MSENEDSKPAWRIDWVEVRTCPTHKAASQYVLVLNALDVRTMIARHRLDYVVLVPRDRAAMAAAELDDYDRELAATPRRQFALTPLLADAEVPLAWCAVLLFFFAAAARTYQGIDWLEAGAVQAGLMRAGQWWRAVTALSLHQSTDHLIGNLVFGSVFSLMLANAAGRGIALFCLVAAGGLGNILNLLIQDDAHTSIGASTSVFAAVGLVSALRQDWRNSRLTLNVGNWLPIAGGLMLLAFLGFSGERTDYGAHVFGFLAGLGLGWVLSWRIDAWRVSARVQWTAGLAAALLFCAAWTVAVSA